MHDHYIVLVPLKWCEQSNFLVSLNFNHFSGVIIE